MFTPPGASASAPVESLTVSVSRRRGLDASASARKAKANSHRRLPDGIRLASPLASMDDPHRLRRLFGAAAHLCQVEVDLAAAGYPELVAKLEDIRAVIDLEIACLEPDDLSQPHCG